MKPYFTIGIPAWKSTYLQENIESVLGQTFTDFELIVVNDASPYPVEEIVKGFSDKRLRYYKNERNYGAGNLIDNWNKCLEYAQGTFFMLLGDDDKLEPDCLEEFSKLITKYPTLDVYHCRTRIIGESSEVIELTDNRPEFETVYDSIWHRMRGFRSQFISDFIYRTDALKSQGGFFKLPLGWVCDDISSFIATGKKGIAHTTRPVFCYRRNNQTMSNTGNVMLKLKAIAGEKDWYEQFLRFIPEQPEDRIQHRNIYLMLPKYIRKKQTGTLAIFGRCRDLLQFRKLRRMGIGWKEIALVIGMKAQFTIVSRLLKQ